MRTASVRILFATIVALVACAASVSTHAQTEVPPYTSSIQVPRGMPTDEKHLLSLVRITPDEAKAAAVAYYDGNFKYVKIHSVAGNLVYAVEFQDGLELMIDAGNKTLLQVKLAKNSVFENARRAMKQ